jgi:hypothetical protein
MTSLLRLYPRSWRERYEAEFLVLMETRPPSVGDRVDIVRGAVDARLHPQVPGADGSPVDARRRVPVAAVLATLSGAAWLAWVGVGLSEFRGWDGPMPGNAAAIALLGAIAGLLLIGAHVAVAMAAGDRLRPIGGLAVSVAAVLFLGAVAGAGSLGTFALIASAVVAVSLGRGTIPRWLAGAWAGSAIVTGGVMVAFVAGGGQDVRILMFMAVYGLAWLAIGGYLLARGAPAAVAADRPDATPASD